MRITPYLLRVALQAGLTLGCTLPFLLVALWRSRPRPRRWALLWLTLRLVVLNDALLEIPRFGIFQRHHWSWQESLASATWPFVLVAVSSISLCSIGVTSRFRPGWLKPSLIALAAAVAVPAVFFLLGSRRRLDAEGWIFLLLMPGLAEELVFRGVFQSLLNEVFGTPWRLGGAHFGWGLIIASILFAASNGLVAVDSELHYRIVIPAAIAPIMLSLVSGWVRERSNSVWPSVFGHNLSNLVIPLATLFA